MRNGYGAFTADIFASFCFFCCVDQVTSLTPERVDESEAVVQSHVLYAEKRTRQVDHTHVEETVVQIVFVLFVGEFGEFKRGDKVVHELVAKTGSGNPRTVCHDMACISARQACAAKDKRSRYASGFYERMPAVDTVSSIATASDGQYIATTIEARVNDESAGLQTKFTRFDIRSVIAAQCVRTFG